MHILSFYRFKQNGRLPPFMLPQDNISLQSFRSSPPRNSSKSKSLPHQHNGGVVNYGPPIRASVRSNGVVPRTSYEGKMSYFVVEENGPVLGSRRGQSKSLFIPEH